MSTQLRAGPVSYLVLGIVAVRGPSTSYDLKRFVQLTIGNFWPFPHTQLYEALEVVRGRAPAERDHPEHEIGDRTRSQFG